MTSQRHRSTQKRAKFGKPISQTGSPWKHAVISNCCILLLCYHAFVNLNDCTCICPGHRGHCVSSDQSQPQHLTEALGNHRQQLISSLIHLRWGSHLLGIRWIPIMISVLHCWGPWKKGNGIDDCTNRDPTGHHLGRWLRWLIFPWEKKACKSGSVNLVGCC